MPKFSLDQTIEALGIRSIPNARFSKLFITQLQTGLIAGQINPDAVVRVVKGIQAGKPASNKGIQQFKHEPLKGFSYAHWSEARFIPQNLIDHWKMSSGRSNKFSNLMFRTCEEEGVDKGGLVTETALKKVIQCFIEGYWERMRNGELTGEWIIFHQGQIENIFLMLSQHSRTQEEDTKKYLRMAAYCGGEFPQLFPNEKVEHFALQAGCDIK